MVQYIDKSALVAEIEKEIKRIYAGREYVGIPLDEENRVYGLQMAKDIIDTLEVIDPYITCVQYTDRESAIKAHAEDYSWNIESELFQQLTPEQQKLWRKEIEQACISGGYSGLNLAKDPRYKENFEVKEVDLEKEYECYMNKEISEKEWIREDYLDFAKHFFELGMQVSNKAQKGE